MLGGIGILLKERAEIELTITLLSQWIWKAEDCLREF
jgi:hypothetical protein